MPHEAHLDIVRSSPSIVERRSIGANSELIGSFERPQCIGEDHVPKEEGEDGSQYKRFRMEPVEEIRQKNDKKAIITTKQTL